MQGLSPRAQAFVAVLLCVVAGFVDAIGYLHSDVFVANMTGNTVLVGIAVAKHEWAATLLRLATIALFFGGAMLGRAVLVVASERQWAPLLLEAVALAVAAFLPAGSSSWTLWLAAAMGMQATGATRFGGVSINTVVVTSAIARLAERAVDALRARRSRRNSTPSSHGKLQAGAWLSYGVGATAGALASDGSLAVLAPAVGLALLAWLLWRRRALVAREPV